MTARTEIDGRTMMPRPAAPPVLWRVLEGLSPYEETVRAMERAADAVARGDGPEQVWLLEHPPLFTAGTRARADDLLTDAFPVHRTGRGGEFTYHGPGQRVAYVMLDLSRRRRDVRAYVAALEEWLRIALAALNIRAETREERVGLWVPRPEKPALAGGEGREDKIAAIGVRLRRWATFHGVAVNIEPDLSHYEGIVPCGVRGHGVTSLLDLGHLVSMAEFDAVLRSAFEDVFGETRRAPSSDARSCAINPLRDA